MTDRFKPGDRVVYVPKQEHGVISSANEDYVFVRFDEQVNKFGWEGATSQACNPRDLKLEEQA